MSAESPITEDEFVILRLDGPPEAGFDRGRAEQTAFFYERAYEEQLALLSVTYVYHARGMLAAFATVCMDALPLGRREGGSSIRYKEVSALKLAQLGVNRPFQRMGIGKIVVAHVIREARCGAEHVGCRYLTLDSQPDLVDW